MATTPGKKRRPSGPDRRLFTDQRDLLPLAESRAWQWWLAAATVLGMALIVYWPTLHNDLINWDDFEYLTKNDYVAERGGLARIWNYKEKHEQFYPMVFTSFWLEHKITLKLRGKEALDSVKGVDHLERGFEPKVHHLTNMVLHGVCAALVVWLLRLLGVKPWVAWLTAALFTVHPINVASVAWTAERKNVLSGVLYLLSFIFYLLDTRLRGTRRRSWIAYGAGLVMFVLALMSKSAMMTLPASAILADRLIERRWSWQSWVRVAPMLILGAFSAYVTKTTEVRNAGVTMVPLEWEYRPFAAAGAIWFYIGKLLLPYHFPGVYTRWDLRGSWPVFMAALAGIPVACGVVWKLRHRLPGAATWGLGHFVVSLFPMLGLVAFNYTQFSFVADHFVYLSSVGVLLCVALAVDYARNLAKAAWGRVWLPTALAGVVLVGMGAASFRHCKYVWKNGESFWVYTLNLNPGCWPGHYNLGNIYRRRASAMRSDLAGLRREAKQVDDEEVQAELLAEADSTNQEILDLLEKAAECYKRSAEAKVSLGQGWANRGDVLATLARTEEALVDYKKALQTAPNNPRYLYYTGDVLVRLDRREEAEPYFQQLIRNNMRQTPDQRGYLANAHYKLGTCYQRGGKPDEALKMYQRCLDVMPNHSQARRAMAGLRAQQPRPDLPPESADAAEPAKN